MIDVDVPAGEMEIKRVRPAPPASYAHAFRRTGHPRGAPETYPFGL